MADAAPDLRALTGLRGLAAWLVVLYHIRSGMGDYLPAPVMALLAKGYLAVDFFFLLSGFVLWLSYAPRFEASGAAYFTAFCRRRIARIWPLHAVILAAAMLFVLLLTLTGRDTSGYPLDELPLHLLLLQNWGFTDALSWNHPAWSISTEMAAYLLFPVIVMRCRWQTAASGTLLAIIILLLGVLHLFFLYGGHATLGNAIPQTGLVRCIIQFTIGTILCVLWQRSRSNMLIAMLALASGILLLAGWAVGAPETLVVPAAFAALLLGAAITAEVPRNPLAAAPLHYLGQISYATYLVHFMLFIGFKLVFVSDPADIAPELIALFLAMTLAASVLLYHGVEKPGQRIFNRLLARPAQPVAAE
ncbi:MAG: acyltransferase [Parasphingorhabdus sp.]|nr:acyltransferase [Parasphingorhabdus sp.]